MIRKSESALLREQLVERRERLRRALTRVREGVEERRTGAAEKDPCAWLDCSAEAAHERDPQRYVAVVMASELELVDQALRRIEREPAAVQSCVRCGSRITSERLAILPYTRSCSGCA